MSEIFHKCRHLGIEMTREEYWAYLRECEKDSTKRIRTQIGRYIFNEHDICLNPERERISVSDGTWGWYVDIMTAECGNGVWVYGLQYNLGDGGGCFGASWADRRTDRTRYDWHESERECKASAGRCMLRYIDNHTEDKKGMLSKLRRKVEEYVRSMERPQVVELSLF